MQKKEIELWEGRKAEVDVKLMDDFDFISDLSKARKDQDLAEMMALYFALVGGEEVFEETRAHIIEDKGFFSTEELLKIIDRIDSAFPKAGNRAQRRSWQSSK